MTRHYPEPTILERLQAGGLRADIVAEFRDRHRKRKPCECRLCRERSEAKQGVLLHAREDVPA